MLLNDVLHVSGINRNTYNTLWNRTGLRFMERGLWTDPLKDGDVLVGKRSDRFNITHAVALATMLKLQKFGIDAKAASSIVDANYDVLIDWVAKLVIFPEASDREEFWLEVSEFIDGYGWTASKKDADTPSDSPPLAQLRINVPAIFDQIWPRYQTLIAAQKA